MRLGYNALHPGTPENLHGLMFGSDKLQVNRSFAEFVINRIATLSQPAMCQEAEPGSDRPGRVIGFPLLTLIRVG